MGGLDLLVTVAKVAFVFGLLFVTLKGLGRVQGLRGAGAPGTAPRRRGGSRPPRRPVEVVDQLRLHRSASVVTVRLGERTIALGVTEAQITDLGEVVLSEPDDDAADADDAAGGAGFLGHALEALRERTVRH